MNRGDHKHLIVGNQSGNSWFTLRPYGTPRTGTCHKNALWWLGWKFQHIYFVTSFSKVKILKLYCWATKQIALECERQQLFLHNNKDLVKIMLLHLKTSRSSIILNEMWHQKCPTYSKSKWAQIVHSGSQTPDRRQPKRHLFVHSLTARNNQEWEIVDQAPNRLLLHVFPTFFHQQLK